MIYTEFCSDRTVVIIHERGYEWRVHRPEQPRIIVAFGWADTYEEAHSDAVAADMVLKYHPTLEVARGHAHRTQGCVWSAGGGRFFTTPDRDHTRFKGRVDTMDAMLLEDHSPIVLPADIGVTYDMR